MSWNWDCSYEVLLTLDVEKDKVDGTVYYYTFNTLLFCLLIINVYWWMLMCGMLVRQIRAGHVSDDVRSGEPHTVFTHQQFISGADGACWYRLFRFWRGWRPWGLVIGRVRRGKTLLALGMGRSFSSHSTKDHWQSHPSKVQGCFILPLVSMLGHVYYSIRDRESEWYRISASTVLLLVAFLGLDNESSVCLVAKVYWTLSFYFR